MNLSFLLRTAATLYGEIKRLMDRGQLRLIAILEKQITPFSSDPPLLAQTAISKLWKKQQKKGREAFDSRAEPKVILVQQEFKVCVAKRNDKVTTHKPPWQLHLSLFTNL